MKENMVNQKLNMKIFSFDAETNGLWGMAFAVSAVVYDTDSKSVLETEAKLYP